MELKDFEKLEFGFENVSIMTIGKEDVNQVWIDDAPHMIDRVPLRRVKISIKTSAEPLEVNPDMSDWDVSEEEKLSQKKAFHRFEHSKGYGDIVDVTLYKKNNTKQVLYPFWKEVDEPGLCEFNMYQYSGFETDRRYELTGNYEIIFYIAAKKSYECVDRSSSFIKCRAYPYETLLPYVLLFSARNRRAIPESYLDGCVLIDTEDQYIPVAVDGSKKVYIKNVCLDDLRPYDEDKISQCIDFIQKHYNDIYDHITNLISDRELLNRLNESIRQQ